MSQTERLSVDEARKQHFGVEQLPAVHRDVLFAVAGIGDRGDPRHGAHFDEVADEISKWYDDRRITPESVEEVMLELDEADFLECVGTGAFRANTSALEAAEAYLRTLGEFWVDVKPWEDGTKMVVERKQVGEDYTDAVDDFLEEAVNGRDQ